MEVVLVLPDKFPFQQHSKGELFKNKGNELKQLLINRRASSAVYFAEWLLAVIDI